MLAHADDSKKRVASPVDTTSFDTIVQQQQEEKLGNCVPQISSNENDSFGQSGEILRPSERKDADVPCVQDFCIREALRC